MPLCDPCADEEKEAETDKDIEPDADVDEEIAAVLVSVVHGDGDVDVEVVGDDETEALAVPRTLAVKLTLGDELAEVVVESEVVSVALTETHADGVELPVRLIVGDAEVEADTLTVAEADVDTLIVAEALGVADGLVLKLDGPVALGAKVDDVNTEIDALDVLQSVDDGVED